MFVRWARLGSVDLRLRQNPAGPFGVRLRVNKTRRYGAGRCSQLSPKGSRARAFYREGCGTPPCRDKVSCRLFDCDGRKAGFLELGVEGRKVHGLEVGPIGFEFGGLGIESVDGVGLRNRGLGIGAID